MPERSTGVTSGENGIANDDRDPVLPIGVMRACYALSIDAV